MNSSNTIDEASKAFADWKESLEMGELIEHLHLTRGAKPILVRVANVFAVSPGHVSKKGCYIQSATGHEIQVEESYDEVVKLIGGNPPPQEDDDAED